MYLDTRVGQFVVGQLHNHICMRVILFICDFFFCVVCVCPEES